MAPLLIEDFFHDIRQEVMVNAEANMDFLEAEFTQYVANELVDSGVTGGFDPCHHRAPTGGVRVDGYWFDESTLDLFITDFGNRETLQSLSQTDANAVFKRAENFFTGTVDKQLFASLEETSDGYSLSRRIFDWRENILKVNFYLLSDRNLSDRLKALEDKQHGDYTFTYNIWDISRLFRLYSSQGIREQLEIDLTEMVPGGLPCLPAHLSSTSYQSYLVVMPANILADLYEKHGARLLEQNVRSFLQIRGNVNKGIRTTILSDPEMFFAYNNGITATAKEVGLTEQENRIAITSMKDFQIVNGGQTTASLFHTRRKDKASLDNIFVQMKLSVVDEKRTDEVVPKISEYANTQNKVNAADFFSNHPFHIRMEEFSRRIWSPAQQGMQRETKWFYERARGQYVDAQSKLTPAEKKRFEVEFPKPQMFTKTDIAKFENVWDDNPVFVNLGAQKNFANYAKRIGQEWEKNSDHFNEFYYRRIVARGIIFRKTERIISTQSWYNGGYRANVVAYTLAMLSHVCLETQQLYNFLRVWDLQDITPATVQAIEVTAKLVYEDITNPLGAISNVTEWCKKDACWTRLISRVTDLFSLLNESFFNEMISKEEVREVTSSAVKAQKMLNGIEAQKAVLDFGADRWAKLLSSGESKHLYSPKEIGVLNVAAQMPHKIPTEKQSFILLEVLEKAKIEGLLQESSN